MFTDIRLLLSAKPRHLTIRSYNYAGIINDNGTYSLKCCALSGREDKKFPMASSWFFQSLARYIVRNTSTSFG